MKRWTLTLTLILALSLLAGCAGKEAPAQPAEPAQAPAAQTPEPASAPEKASEPEQPAKEPEKVASADQMVTPEEVVEEGMAPIPGSELNDGSWPVEVNSSSSMFNVESCDLTVEDGKMTAVLHMGGKGYLKVFMGTGEEAAAADEADCIPFLEDAGGNHSFTVPVEALDAGIPCAAFSKNKEMWYDRTLLFRADSLPDEAFRSLTTVESLGLADGTYKVEVSLSGGSGRASVESPAPLTVKDGQALATIVWGSSNYDYMRVGKEQYLPLDSEGNSTFEIPVAAFDRAMTVYADTTAMSTPHEIEYTLRFDSSTIQ